MAKLFSRIVLLVFLSLGLGCDKPLWETSPSGNGVETDGQKDKTSAVIVGMDESETYGSCPGAKLDAKRMKEILAPYVGKLSCFISGEAKKGKVAAALKEAVDSSELTIFYYSGHGGSLQFADTGSEEEDGADEFLCLDDTLMRDNEIWDIISKAKGRVFLLYDCCHSATLFKSPVEFMFLPSLRAGDTTAVPKRGPMTFKKFASAFARDAAESAEAGFSMLCWSGCGDDTFSYGGLNGGQFTNCLLFYLKKNQNQTYNELWKSISGDEDLLLFQKPFMHEIGAPFSDRKIFR